jgi:hypothetical protein
LQTLLVNGPNDMEEDGSDNIEDQPTTNFNNSSSCWLSMAFISLVSSICNYTSFKILVSNGQVLCFMMNRASF